MKYCYCLLIIGFISSCGESETPNSIVSPLDDTVSNGIIEYELNEERISAVEFNNALSLIQQHVLDQIDLLFTSDAASVAGVLDNATFDIELKISDLKNTQVPDGGDTFKQALEDLLLFYKNELNGGFKAVLPLLEKEPEERLKEEEFSLIDYDEQFAIQEATFFKTVIAAQDAFALANNIKIK